MRLESSLISQAWLTAPWALHTSARQNAIYHAVVGGRCWFKSDAPESDAVRLETGDVIVVFDGEGHCLFTDANTPITSIRKACEEHGIPGPVARLKYGGDGEETRLICGTFTLQHAAGESLYALLPDLLHIGAHDGAVVQWLNMTLGLVEAELHHGTTSGRDAVMTRLLDVVLIQILRAYVARLSKDATGWLAATRDAQIGQALALIHENPEARLTVPELASKVGMSRSSFFARFSELVGEPPARYLTRWRMHSAADMLARFSKLSIAELAEKVGYMSEDAFSKAFKRHIGHSPAAYRRLAS